MKELINLIIKSKHCSNYQDIFIINVSGQQLALRIGKTPIFVAQVRKSPPATILHVKNGICSMISIPDGCQAGNK